MENLSQKLPVDFVLKMKSQLGENYFKYETAINKNAVRGIRVNTKKVSVENFKKIFKEQIKQISYESNGFVIETDEKLGNEPEHLSGLYYFQEPSSMVPVAASKIEGSVKVLDLCASPGGKTGQIACRTNDDSLIFSNEIIKSRAEILYSNVERQGFKNVVILNEEPKNLLKFENFFDYVFVDAPCSGEGMFRKNPETILEWSEENSKMCATRQMEILEIAEKLVAPGGKLVYSTCTFSEREDEKIVEWFLNKFDFELQDVGNEIKNSTLPSNANVKNSDFARKFYPFSGTGEGQFVAVFEKMEQDDSSKLFKKKHFKSLEICGRKDRLSIDEFENLSLKQKIDGKFIKSGLNIFVVPKNLDDEILTTLDELKFVSIGVKIGSIQKERFEPNHAIFMAYQDLFKVKIELSDDEVKKYLHGEELACNLNEKGYAVVTKNGFALGGVKISGGKLKNLYPKGLRI